MYKLITLITLSLFIVSCDKYKVPKFSEATLVINESNYEQVLDATDQNFQASYFLNVWLFDYPISISKETDFNTTYTYYCEIGRIIGEITDGKDSTNKFELEANITFDSCDIGSKTINGSIKYQVELSKSEDSYAKIVTEGDYTIQSGGVQFSLNSHYLEMVINESYSVFKQYAQIKIDDGLNTNGTVNYYIEEPVKLSDTSATGLEIVEGGNNTSIEIKYSSTYIDFFLNDTLHESFYY